MLKRITFAIIVTIAISPCPVAVALTAGSRIALGVAEDVASATISGSVVDLNGGIVADAKITVINDRLGVQRGTVTNNIGSFEIPFLLPGIYTLTVQMTGFATLMVTGLDAQAGLNRKIIITLQPRGVAETIRVQADQAGINRSDATLTYSIGREQVESFPIIATAQGRNVLGTVPFLLPGILPGFNSGIRGEGLIVNGARPLANYFTIDGGDNNDYEFNKAAAPFPNPDALQEITVVTSNHKANLAGANGGVFNAVIKSGSNEFHGNARYFFSNGALNARDFFNYQRPLEHLNNFGGQAGGPVFIPRLYDGRNRTHFFVDFEGNGLGFQAGLLFGLGGLSEAGRTGDFSSLPLPNANDGLTGARQPIDPLTGEVFPGGKIPANRIDPLARLYLERFVPGTDPANDGRLIVQPGKIRNRQLTTRIDHSLGDIDRLSATYYYYINRREDPGLMLPLGTGLIHAANHGLTVRETHLFSPRTVNEVSGTFINYRENLRTRRPGFTGVDPQEAGFRIRPQDARFVSLPNVNINSMPAIGPRVLLPIGSDFDTTHSSKTVIAVKDDLVHTYTSHTLSLGGGIRAFLFERDIPGNSGSFEFSDSDDFGTGNGVADFLLGMPSFYSQNTGISQNQRQTAYFGYAMDDWKVRPNLTINLGLRYELAPPVYDDRAPASVFRPGKRSRIFPLAPEGQLFSGDPDPILGTVPRGGYRADGNNIAPRFGLAYSPGSAGGPLGWLVGENRTSIRAGFGVFFSSAYGANLTDLATGGSPYTFSVALGPRQPAGFRQIGTFSDPWGPNLDPFPIPIEKRFDQPSLSTSPQSALTTFDPASRSSYTYQYNLSIQRELRWSTLLEVGYVGSSSFKLERQRDMNPPVVDPASPGIPTSRFPFLLITNQETSGRARYDSLQVRLSRRLSGGLLLDTSYVFSKALDNASGPKSAIRFTRWALPDARTNVTDPYSWARSSFDRRHAFVASYTYYIPGLSGDRILARLSRGWVIGGLTQVLSGKPIEIQVPAGRLSSFSHRRPDLVGAYRRLDPRRETTFRINGTSRNGHFFFDPTAFDVVTVGEQGTLGRNVLDGPGLNSTSISIARRTRVFRSQEIELRADIVNLFNQVNFGDPGLAWGTSNFGVVYSSLNPRTIQLSLRYRF